MECNGIDTFEFNSNINPEDFEDSDDDNLYETCQEQMYETHENQDEEENKSFVVVTDENGKERKIRKSTYIWMLSEPCERLSKDRLTRVRINHNKRSYYSDSE